MHLEATEQPESEALDEAEWKWRAQHRESQPERRRTAQAAPSGYAGEVELARCCQVFAPTESPNEPPPGPTAVAAVVAAPPFGPG